MSKGNCSSGCPTPGEHQSYGECMRAKSNRIAYCNSAGGWDATAQKTWDKELAAYKDARSQGVQPAGTKRSQVENALRISETTGTAYQAG